MSVLMPLSPVERTRVTQEIAAQFRGKPLDFAGGVTCIHLLRAQMVAFGYSVPEIPAFSDVLSAKRALRKTGHRTLKGLIGKYLSPVPLTQMRVGDIALAQGEPFEAVCINAGGGKFLGWHDQGQLGLVNIIIDHAGLIGAWRLV